ncbi:MAG: Fe-S cluster assembly scaffold protein NifU [Calditrichia bacterium]
MLDEKRFEILRSMGYSQKAIDLIQRKVHLGEMEDPTVVAKHQGKCGDIMILYLKIEDDIIKDATFEYVGCAGLHSAGAGLIEMIKGKSVDEVRDIQSTDIIQFLESLPVQKYECAEIAANTLHKALETQYSQTP